MPIVFHRGPIKPLKSKPKDGETFVPKSLDNRHPIVRGLSQAAHALGMPTVRRSSSVTTAPRAAAPARRDIGAAPPGSCLGMAPPPSTAPETMDLEANIAYLRSHPEVVADVERNIEDLRRVHGRMVRRTGGEIFVKPGLQAMLDDLQGVVLLHGVLTYEKSLLSRVLCPRLRIHDPGQGGSLRLEQFDFEPGGADTHWPDTPSTVVAINGNNDEASVRWLAGELRRTPNVTVVTSAMAATASRAASPCRPARPRPTASRRS